MPPVELTAAALPARTGEAGAFPLAWLRALRRVLRAPRLIVANLIGLASLAAIGATVPQVGVATEVELHRFGTSHPDLAPLVHRLGMDEVFRGRLFLLLVVWAASSLCVVEIELWKRLFRAWREPLSERSFRLAPFRTELERPSRRAPVARTRFTSSGRLSLLGTPLFHLGILLVVIAGILRALFGASAAVDLIEGETLAPTSAFGAQWPGPLASPFSFLSPLSFDRLLVRLHPSGEPSQLTASVSLPAQGATRRATVAVNAPLKLPGGWMYQTTEFGPAALFEARGPWGVEQRALLLERSSGGGFAGSTQIGDLEVRMRATAREASLPPRSFEARLLRGGALLFVGNLAPGSRIEYAKGERLDLLGARYWTRFRGARDDMVGLAYAGIILTVLGAIMMLAFIRVDTAVIVKPTDRGERVVVALRASRLAPLFAERFEALQRAEREATETEP